VSHLLERLDEITACRPVQCLVMIGGNDLLAIYDSPMARRNVHTAQLLARPTLGSFERDLTVVVERLTGKGVTRVVLMSLSMAGELAGSVSNARVDRVNEVIRTVAERTGAAYAPVNERLWAELRRRGADRGKDLIDSPLPVVTAVVLHLGLGLPFGLISRLNGYRFLVEGVHLNRAGGTIVADVLTDLLLTWPEDAPKR
jgi:lysophospholipase L1-like esterase